MIVYNKFGGAYQLSPWVSKFANNIDVIKPILDEVDVYGCLQNNVQAGIPIGVPHPQVSEFVERVNP